MMKQWTTLLVFLFLSLSLSAQQEYGRDIFVSSKGDSLPYRMIHPESVKPGEKYPLVLFLHGAGERGNDNEKQLTHGGQMFLNPVNQEKYPAFVLIPQCPTDGYWAASEIASRSRGTPRIANALLRRVRDFAQVKGTGSIDTEIAQFALEALNIDKYGLDEIDNKILCTIIDKFKGGPVGITTIATALGEDAGTIEEVYEPFLIKEGFMKRTPRGREVTELAYKHLGRSLYNSQKTLFND